MSLKGVGALKRLIAFLIVAATVLNYGIINAEPLEPGVDVSFPADAVECVKPPRDIGTVPSEDEAVYMQAISQTDVDISNEIYKNFLECDPNLFRLTDKGLKNLNDWDEMTDDELEYVRLKSAEITAGCTTADQKIYAVMKYLAENVCYDYDYYYHNTKEYAELNHHPYDVLTQEITVCYGYAATASALLLIAGVPCVNIFSPGHAWNMAYNGTRWVLFDITWISNGRYEYGVLEKSDILNLGWFDFTIDKANSNYNHLITEAAYSEYGNCIYAFPIHTMQNSFEIPESVTAVGDYAFYGGTELNLTCKGKLESVGIAAFYNCSNLDGVVIIEDGGFIDAFAFYCCSALDKVIVDEGIREIPEAAFYDCISLEKAELPDTVTVIGEYAFCNCSNAEMICKGKLESLGSYAFYMCRKLSGTINMKNLESIGTHVFFGCSSIKNIAVGEGITTLPYAVFYNCSALTTVELPRTVTYIDEFAFGECSALNRVYYAGTSGEWSRINIAYRASNIYLINSTITCNHISQIRLSSLSSKVYRVLYTGIPAYETVVYGEYKDGMLLGIKIEDIDSLIDFNLMNTDADEIRAFVIDDFRTMRPSVGSKRITR